MITNPEAKTQTPKSILILGGGPSGLYCGLLIKKADPSCRVTIVERNPAGVTYGWGVVFSDRTMASFQRADYKTYEQITRNFVIWDAIDVRYRGETIRCGGHVIASIERKKLLGILLERCAELGVEMHFDADIHSMEELGRFGEYDLLIASDGVNSLVRREYEAEFKPRIEMGRAKYIWLGADKVLDAFTFIFHQNEHGLFQAHAYPFNGTTSTFIVECDEQTWLNARLDRATEQESLAYCQSLLSEDLNGASLLSNNSKWISFPTLKTSNWHITTNNQQPTTNNYIVLMGDAAHTAHFSIGSGTKLAMEDAIALANALEQHGDIEAALNEYEAERKPVVDTFQRAAYESQTYFETLKRYLNLDPIPFAFQLLTRSGRITYDDLHFRDARFGDRVDRWMFGEGREGKGLGARGWGLVGEESSILNPQSSSLIFAPSPVFAPFKLGRLCLRNRIVIATPGEAWADGVPGGKYGATIATAAMGGVGLVLTPLCAVLPEGRVSPRDLGLWCDEQAVQWQDVVRVLHAGTDAKIGVQLGHAGRRGATRSRAEGLDRPLSEGGWPLLSASALPYTPTSQLPREMSRADMDAVRDAFISAAKRAAEAGFDLLQLPMAHGYLLASFFSPLTNRREDEYGGSLHNRVRYPLEVLGAVRAVWPEGKPLSVALNANDYARGGLGTGDAVEIARLLKAAGCDLVQVLAGQTTAMSAPPYARGFLTPLSDRVRNEAGVPTMVGGYLTTSNEANTILAAGRGDLCVIEVQ